MDTELFPSHLLLNEPDRGRRLLAEFYQQYHEKEDRTRTDGQDMPAKASFFKKMLVQVGSHEKSLGLDIGCRYGTLIKMIGTIDWLGVDVDPEALKVARASGIRAEVMDFMSDIGFKDECLDAVMMTEVLEHLPYPSIIVQEVHRILKKERGSIFMGSVPLDYHLHRRWKVLRGKRLSGEQTHVHHFSFHELDRLLRFYFDRVEYQPLRGTAWRYPKLGLSYDLFVRDIAWAAASPKREVGRWGLGKV